MRLNVQVKGLKELSIALDRFPKEVISKIESNMDSFIWNNFDSYVQAHLASPILKPTTKTGDLARSFSVWKSNPNEWTYGQMPMHAMARTVPYSYGQLLEYGFYNVLSRGITRYPFFWPAIGIGLPRFYQDIYNVVNEVVTETNKKK